MRPQDKKNLTLAPSSLSEKMKANNEASIRLISEQESVRGNQEEKFGPADSWLNLGTD